VSGDSGRCSTSGSLDDPGPRLAPGVIFWETDAADGGGTRGGGGRLEFLDGSASFELNATALEVVRHCHGRTAVDEIVRRVAGRFVGSSLETVDADVREFIAWGLGRGVLLDDGTPHSPAPDTIPSITTATVPLPTTVYVSLTARCNLRCRFCYARPAGAVQTPLTPATAAGGELTAPQWLRLLRHLAAGLAGGSTLVFTGGEPTLHPEFVSVAAGARELGFRLQMYTNGTLLDTVPAGRCADLGFEAVGVSIHGARAATADRLSGVPGGFRRAVRGIVALVAAGVPVAWQATVTPDNLEEVPAMAHVAARLGVSHFRAGSVDFTAGGCRPLTPEGEVGFWRAMAALAEEYAGRMSVGLAGDACESADRGGAVGATAPPPSSACGIGRHICHLRPDGRLTPCPVLRDGPWDLGSPLETDFSSLWRGADALRPLRGPGLDGLSDCPSCGLRHYCRGGCRAGAWLATGDIAGCDHKRRRAILALVGEGPP